MNVNKLITALILAAGTLFVGCGGGHKEGDGHAQADAGHEAGEKQAGIAFSEKSGLRVSAETAKFIGLEVAEIEERKVASEFRFAARVYRAASEARFASTLPMVASSALASGLVSPAEASLLREGQPISVSVEGAVPLVARITALDRRSEWSEVEVLLSVPDEQGRLTNGAFVALTVPLGGEKTVISVPRSALLRTMEGDFAYTVSGEAFVRAPLKLGAVNSEFAEVTDGLYAGDQVVVKPAMTLWLAEIQALRGGKACSHGH